MSAAGSNGAWSAGAADIPWGAPPPLSPLSPPAPPAFPGQVDDDDDSMRDAAEDDDTRSPLRFATAAAAATSTGAASASAAAPADPPSLSIRPGFSGGIGGGGGGGGGGTGGGQREISEETYGQLEAAAFALSFAEFCNRLEAAKRAAGAQGKVDAYFYARDFKGRLQVGWAGWV